MTEAQDLKLRLLDVFAKNGVSFTISDWQKGYDFLMKDETKVNEANVMQEVAQKIDNAIPNGIYLVYADGSVELFNDNTAKPVEKVAGIGIKQGDWALVVDLHDQADGEEITLTTKKGSETYKGYKDNYLDAVADWNGKANTEHLIAIGLNERIELKETQYIPSLGEMYFIYMNLKAVNKALEFVGGTPIERDWYWTSTERSATYAWYLRLDYGYASHGITKASFSYRVRAVSAFIL